MDDATQRRRLRNEVKQSRQLQVTLAHVALDRWRRHDEYESR
jgi:hypothetical protein